MKETRFIQQNREKWNEFEKFLHDGQHDPEKITRLFVEITEDLSYARTFYPNRTVRFYLNRVAQYVYNKVNRNRIFRWSSFWNFWADELPWIVYTSRRQLQISLILFVLCMLLGMFISAFEPSFAETIFGKHYVEETISNIEQGDPMAVYKKSGATGMFLGITLNNVRVAFLIFISGLLAGIGTVYVLIINALMVGAFQYFFYERGVLQEALITIWQHGTIEIASIIIAGAAGIILGSGLAFPGSYTRGDSFRLSAYRSVKLFLGTVPLFIFAAFIEGFITRHTESPLLLRIMVIACSVGFIGFYFIWIPWKKHRANPSWGYPEEKIPPARPFTLQPGILSNGLIIKESFGFLKENFSKLASIALAGGGSLVMVFILLYQNQLHSVFIFPGYRSFIPSTPFLYIRDLYAVFNPFAFPLLSGLMVILMTWVTCCTLNRFSRMQPQTGTGPGFRKIALTFLVVILAFSPFLLTGFPLLSIAVHLLLAPFWLMAAIAVYSSPGNPFGMSLKVLGKYYFRVLWLLISAAFIAFLVLSVFATPVMFIYIQFITQHIPPDLASPALFYVGYLLFTGFFGIALLFPFVLVSVALKKNSVSEIETAVSLIAWFSGLTKERRAYGFRAEN